MAGNNENGVALLQRMRGKPPEEAALKIIKVVSTDPAPITFIFEGSSQALDLDIFEIPVGLYPLRKGDRLLVLKLVGQDTDGLRWAAVEKINGGVTLATMASGSSLKIDGIDKTYGASDLVIPPYFAVANDSTRYSDSYTGKTSDYYLLAADIKPLAAGDMVSIAPTLVSGKIKYVILERY